MRAGTLTACYLLDCMMGDPEWLPHPVRIIGRVVGRGEKILRHFADGSSTEFMSGALLTSTVVLGSGLATWKILQRTNACSRPLRGAAEVWLGATCLATRNLLDEANAVMDALENASLQAARLRLARIVGRDTDGLDESDIARAVIETLAESLCDGIIAPLFYLTVGGVPLAMAYKASNTLDSMIGHRSERYEWFGKAAARLDDALNFVPSRITAVLICGSATLLNRGAFQRAHKTWLLDAGKHASPNAGHAESAMAGALGVQLGGVNSYGGEHFECPLLGAGFAKPDAAHARQAMRIVAIASVLGFALGCLVLSRRRNG